RRDERAWKPPANDAHRPVLEETRGPAPADPARAIAADPPVPCSKRAGTRDAMRRPESPVFARPLASSPHPIEYRQRKVGALSVLDNHHVVTTGNAHLQPFASGLLYSAMSGPGALFQ